MSKNIIYIDNNLLNSSIAQIEGGVPTSKTDTISNSKTDTDTEGINGKVGARINARVASLDANIGGNLSNKTDVTSAESQLLDTAFHDFLVNILLEDVDDVLQRDDTNLSINDYVLLNSNFAAYDFEQLKHISDPNIIDTFKESLKKSSAPNIQNIKDEIKKLRKLSGQNNTIKALQEQKANLENPAKDFEYMLDAIRGTVTFADALYPKTVLFSNKTSIVLANKSNFRISTSQISSLYGSNHSIKVLGIVLSKDLETGRNPFTDNSPEEINKLPGILSNYLLSSFNISDKNGSNIIQPIAIYFE